MEESGHRGIGREAELMPLIERDDQLAKLCGAYAASTAGKGRIALVTGGVASGKTALLDAFAEHVSSAGGRFLAALGSRSERDHAFGIMGQLLRSAAPSPPDARRPVELPAELPATGLLHEPGSETPRHLRDGDRPGAAALRVYHAAVVDLAGQGPVVLAVDDAHYADVPSMHCLLYLVRRMRTTPAMLVLSEAFRPRPAHPLFRTELLSQPHCARILLAPLSRRAVEEMAAHQLGPTAARSVSDDCFEYSGGSPLLARALLDDHATTAGAGGEASPRNGPSWPRSLVVGDEFDQAVLACLYRHDAGTLAAARALAVLDRSVTAELLGDLLGVVTESATQAIRVLEHSGLLVRGGFRHPRARAAVLQTMSAQEQHDLHRRAAGLLRDEGASSSVVAGHLVAATGAEQPWAVPVLQDAAEEALAAGNRKLASSCLRLAGRMEIDGGQRANTTALLVSVEWQLNPAATGSQLTSLLQAARSGDLSVANALALVPHLLWHGRPAQAIEVLSGVAGSSDPPPPDTGAALRAAQLLVSCCHPGYLPSIRQTPSAWTRMKTAPGTVSPLLQGATVLAAVLRRPPNEDVVAGAEQLLQRCELDDAALGPMLAALVALIQVGRSDRVATWSDRLLDRPVIGQAPFWHAVLKAVRAEAALRLGDLVRAEAYGASALAAMPVPAWGVAIGAPVATLVLAASETGRFEEAAGHLRLPVPQAMFRTPFGLQYLRARGRYFLATGRHQAALTDFRACGELMDSWGLDLPTLVPWRLEVARVQLRQGLDRQAAESAGEQLRATGDTDAATRGVALRLLAAASPPERRTPLLKEAVELLQRCGDRVELAHALADTGHLLRELADFSRGRLMIRRARQTARESGALLLCRSLFAYEPSAATTLGSWGPAAESGEGLSDAERRVAVLAAQGLTNREISGKLHVTVSTVEQHLTRVYRKLNVKRRTDLPTGLSMPEPAA
jgi:DNA-binding CsgD family transcriptional regulator